MQRTATVRTRPAKAALRAFLAALIAVALLPAAALLPAQKAYGAEISGDITASTTWNDGDVITGSTFIYGGTEDEPIVITVNGTVRVKGVIYATSQNIGGSYIGGYVVFTGGGTLLRDETRTSGYMITRNAASVPGSSVTLEDVTIDGNLAAMEQSDALLQPAISVSSTMTLTLGEGAVLQNHFSKSTSTTNSGVVQVNGGTLILDGGTIRDSKNGYGGAIHLRTADCLTINSGTIENVTNLTGTENWAINTYVANTVAINPANDISIQGKIFSQNSMAISTVITPQGDYPISSVVANGVPLSAVDGTYTLPAITSGLEIAVGAGGGGTTEPTLIGVAKLSDPTKLAYTAGETFDAAGLAIVANYDDDSQVAITDYTVSKTTALAVGDTAITVSGSYEGEDYSFTFPITVAPLTGPGDDPEADLVIHNAAEFADFRDAVNGLNGKTAYNFQGKVVALANDIDLSTVCGPGIGSWVGIGTSGQDQFRGTFDGYGHTISNLYINDASAGANQGLFSLVSYPAVLENFVVTGEVTAGDRAAGVASYASGAAATPTTIRNVGNEVDVTAVGTNTYAAGIVGGTSNQYVNISNCYNNGTITGASGEGGIVGLLGANVHIDSCYNAGSIVIKGAALNGGGIIGSGNALLNTGTSTLSNSFNIGSISSTTMSGSTGSYGALIGNVLAAVNAGTTNNYYLATTPPAPLVLPGSVAKTAEELASPEFLALINGDGDAFKAGATHPILAWEVDDNGDGSSITIDPAVTNGTVFANKTKAIEGETVRLTVIPDAGYHFVAGSLKVNDGAVALSGPYTFTMPDEAVIVTAVFDPVGDGSGDSWTNAIHIATQEELAAVGPVTGTNAKYYILDNDIELTGLSGAGWVPIGTSTSITFSGHFDGAGHTVSGLWTDRTAIYTGLFGCLSGFAEIKNLDVVIDDASGGVRGRESVGGLVANVSGNATISNCSVTGSVTGTQYIGGLAARAYAGTSIDNCSVAGSVTGTGTGSVGGLLGTSGGDLTNSHADSTVTGTTLVGGLIGSLAASSISNCYANSTVTGTGAYVGGLIGHVDRANVSNCYANSTVTATSTAVGGLIGRIIVQANVSSTITGCFSTGRASGTGSVGGLVGEVVPGTRAAPANLVNVYSSANVTGTTGYVGGLIGNLESGHLSNAYAVGGTVTSTATSGAANAVGGLVGFAASASPANTFASVYAANTVVGTWQAGALVGRWAPTTTAPVNSYVDTEVSGQAKVIGLTTNANAAAAVTGRTTAQMAGRFAPYYLGDLPADGFAFRAPTEDFGYYPELKVFMDSADADVRVASEASVRTTAQEEVAGAALTAIGSSRPNTATAIVDFSSDSFGSYYYAIVEKDAPAPVIDTAVEGNALLFGPNNLTFTDWTDYTAKDIYIVAKNPADELGDAIKIAIDEADITAPVLTGVVPLRLTRHLAAVAFESDETGTYYYAVVDKDAPAPEIDTQGAGTALAAGANSITITGLEADEQKDVYIIACDTSGNLTEPMATAVGAFEGYYQGGDGSGDSWLNAIHITTQAQLEAVRPASGTNGKYYILDNDIELTGLSGVGWVPIGTTATITFSGHFDGDDHAVSGLWANRTASYTGLFGYLAANAEVRNLDVAIDNMVASGGVKSTSSYTGGLVGYAAGGATIENCSVTGNVSGVSYVGGLAGYATGTTISNSHADSTVTGTSTYVGGLVGYAAGVCVISNSFSSGSVAGTGNVGGLAGMLAGSATNTYSSSNVTGTTGYVGGLIGNLVGNVTNSYVANGTVTSSATNGASNAVGGLIGYVSNGNQVSSCYAANTVVGAWQAGAFVGNWGSATTQPVNCYVDTEVSGQANAIGLATNTDAAVAVTDLATAQMAGSAALDNMASLNGDPAAFAVRPTDAEHSYYPELVVFKDSANPAVSAASKASAQTDPVETTGPEVGEPGSGDLDGDGLATLDEALLLVQIINNDASDALSAAQIDALDVNRDGFLTMADVLLIVQIVLNAA